jgi:ribosome-associated toxin RatA of RatAB toxin-antitoxin module
MPILFTKKRCIIPLLMVMMLTLISSSLKALPVTETPDSLTAEQTKLLNGAINVELSNLPDGVTGVKGDIFIAAPPETVWAVITDYDNHKNYIPNVLDSGLISDNGTEKVMFEKGKSGMFIFRKTVNITMKVWGERPKRLNFEQITGEFKVYRGEWLLLDYPLGKGTFLTYRAEVKPDFFAPGFAVRNVQKRDCPLMLAAMKKRAESPPPTEEKGK